MARLAARSGPSTTCEENWRKVGSLMERAIFPHQGRWSSAARPIGRIFGGRAGLLQRRREGFGPAGVAFGGEMEEIGHDFLGKRAVGLEEGGIDVEEGDIRAEVEFGEGGVDFVVVEAFRVAGFFRAGEDGEQRDFGLRESLGRASRRWRSMPATTSARRVSMRWPVLLVPIMRTTTLG